MSDEREHKTCPKCNGTGLIGACEMIGGQLAFVDRRCDRCDGYGCLNDKQKEGEE